MTDSKAPRMSHEEIRARAEASRMDDSHVSRRLAHACLQLLDEQGPLREALEFYADPEVYHGVAFMFDPPGGGWKEDFSEDHGNSFYERPMPGMRARAALDKASPNSPTPAKNIGWIKCHVCGGRTGLDRAVICGECGQAVHEVCIKEDGTCMKCMKEARDG